MGVQIQGLRYVGTRIRRLALCAMFFSGLAGAAHAATPEPKIAGIYSDLHYSQEGGDLLGMELLVVPTESGYAAFVQIAEGGAPYTAMTPVGIAGTHVSFELPPGGAYGGVRFTGEWNGSSLVVTWPAGDVETLRRGKSYWQ